jgi:hypothetical protein
LDALVELISGRFAVMEQQLLASATAPVADAAGGAFDALHGDLFGESLGAVPAA